jgi:hypothetical protein
MRERSTFSCNTARMVNYLIGLIGKDVWKKPKLQEYFIRFYQRSAIYALVDLATEISNPKTSSLMNTGMQS